MPSPVRPDPTQIRDYLRVAPFYDRLASAYSLGAIGRSKGLHLQHLAPRSKLMYAGGGTGQEAILAAAQGHEVQIWDPSASMLARARTRLAELPADAQARVKLVQAGAQEVPPQEDFDAVVCNYFLNLFAPHEIPWWLERLALQLRPDASLWIADFAPLQGPWRGLAWAYHALPLTCFRYWTGNAKHDPYDYPRLFAQLGWRLCQSFRVGLSPWGPHWFACWKAQPPPRA